MQGTGTSVSQLPTTEALPRLDMGAPGLVPAGLIPQQTFCTRSFIIIMDGVFVSRCIQIIK
eukprot:6625561-Prorocentrum_lima.AAC.1